MTISNVDATIVGLFLITTLIVGLKKGFGIKTVREYAVGNKDFSDFALASTIFASIVGANAIFGGVERSFKVGIIYLFAITGYSFSYLLIGHYLGPKMDNFQDKISSGEIIEERYGAYGRALTGFLGFFYSIGLIALQIVAIGNAFNLFFNLPYAQGAMLGFGIVVIYSALGGIKSVTFTDIFQFIIIIAIIPLVAVEALRKAGDYDGLFTFLKTNYTTHINPFLDKDLLKEYLPLFFILSIPSLSPMKMQRLLMARTGSQAKKIFIHTAFFYLLFICIISLLGLCVLKLNASLKPSLAFPYIIQKIMPVGVSGIAIAGLIAAIMSSADSLLNSGSISLIHDGIKPLTGEKLSDKSELLLTKITTFLCGLLALIIATKFDNMLSILLISKQFWMPLIVPALLGTIMGFKTTPKRFWGAMGGGIAFLLLWGKFLTPIWGVKPLLPATFFNALVFFGVTNSLKFLATPITAILKKILNLFKTDFEDLKLRTLLKISRFFSKAWHFGPILPKLSEYCKISERAQGDIGRLFGVFMVTYCLAPQFFVLYEPNHPEDWFLMRTIAGISCIFLIIKESSPFYLKRYSGIFYYIALTICLPMHSAYLFFDTVGSTKTLVNLIFSITILAFFLEAKNYIVSLILGYILGTLFFLRIYNFDLSALQFIAEIDLKTTSFFVIVSLIFGYLFSKTKSTNQKQLLESAESMAGIVAHELRTPLATLALESGMLETSIKLIEKNHLALEEQNIQPAEFEKAHIERARKFLKNKDSKIVNTEKLIDIVLHNVKQRDCLNEYPVKLNIKDCVEEAVKTYPYSSLEKDTKLINVNLENNFDILGTKSLIIHIIYNLMKNSFKAIKLAKKGEIFIYSDKKLCQNRLIVEDTGIGIPEKQLAKVTNKFASYWKKGTGLGLAFCKDSMKAMKGYIDVESKEGQFTRIILTFPQFRAKQLLKKQPKLRKSPKRICLLDPDASYLFDLHNKLKNRISFSSLEIQLDSIQALRDFNDIYYKSPPSDQIAAVVGSPDQGESFFTYLQDRRIKRIWLTDGIKNVEDNPYINVAINKNDQNSIDSIAKELDWPLENLKK